MERKFFFLIGITLLEMSVLFAKDNFFITIDNLHLSLKMMIYSNQKAYAKNWLLAVMYFNVETEKKTKKKDIFLHKIPSFYIWILIDNKISENSA